MTQLSKLARLLERMTGPRWWYEDERYSAKCILRLEGDDRWLAHCQPEFNGEANGIGITALVNLAPYFLKVTEAASLLPRGFAIAPWRKNDTETWMTNQEFAEFEKVHILTLMRALAALDAAIIREVK